MGRPSGEVSEGRSNSNKYVLVATAAAIVGAVGLILVTQLTLQQHSGARLYHVQPPLSGLSRNASTQLDKLATLMEQLQQQVTQLESSSIDRVHSAINSTKDAVSDMQEALQRVFARSNDTSSRLDALLTKTDSALVRKEAPCPSPSPSPPPPPRVKRLVVSMSSFPGRAEYVNPTVYSIMYGKRKPDVLYLWVAVNITRLDNNAEKAIPGEAKAVGAQFPDVVKVQLSEDFGPATKLLPTLKVETDPETVIVTVDDDTYYHQDTVFDLEQAMISRQGHAIVRSCEVTFKDTSVTPPNTWRNWKLDEGLCPGFMTAYASAAYRRSFFDDAVFKQKLGPRGCWDNDDIWFSAHLWLRQIPIWVLRPHVHAWPVLYHRPKNRLSISTHPEAGKWHKECLDYFGWLSSNSSDIRDKLVADYKA